MAGGQRMSKPDHRKKDREKFSSGCSEWTNQRTEPITNIKEEEEEGMLLYIEEDRLAKEERKRGIPIDREVDEVLAKCWSNWE